jgi:hypothetical protein
MPQRADAFDLGALGLTSGEGRRLELHVHVDPFDLGGARYAPEPALIPVRLDVSRTTHGWLGAAGALRGRAAGPVHALPGAGHAGLRRSTRARSTSPAAARS